METTAQTDTGTAMQTTAQTGTDTSTRRALALGGLPPSLLDSRIGVRDSVGSIADAFKMVASGVTAFTGADGSDAGISLPVRLSNSFLNFVSPASGTPPQQYCEYVRRFSVFVVVM